MPPSALPLSATGPEQRRRRRRLTRAGLLLGFSGGLLAAGVALGGPLAGRLVGRRAGLAALALLLGAGLALALRVRPAERALAGRGWLAGRATTGAGLGFLLDALALPQWDRAAFALGLALFGAWLAKGAAPPRDVPLEAPGAAGPATARVAAGGRRLRAGSAGRWDPLEKRERKKPRRRAVAEK